MLKALLKKQWLELNSAYIIDRKTGKKRSKVKTLMYAGLLLFVFGIIGGYAYGLAGAMAKILLPAHLDWLYFSIMILVTIFVGVFGSVFHTYASLYNAKDNDLLLSLPIPVYNILITRLLSIFLMGLLYEVFIYIPTIIAYIQYGHVTWMGVLLSILMLAIIGGIVSVLTCLLGWVVALIASKIKHKNIVIVFFSILFFILYYYFIFNYSNLFMTLMANVVILGDDIKAFAYPLYALGMAASGSILHFLGSFIVVLILVGLTCFVLSKTFLKITTHARTGIRAKYKERKAQMLSLDKALLKREWSHLLSSATYLLNCSLGTFFMPICAIAALFMQDRIHEMVQYVPLQSMFTIVLAAGLCILSSMNITSAASVSLEGKTIWIVQSLPIPTKKILHAKYRLQEWLTIPVLIFDAIVFSILLKLGIIDCIFILLTSASFVLLLSRFGLMMNLLRPNLEWTNETVPVKQSLSVMITLFGGWIVGACMIGLCFLFMEHFSYYILLSVAILLFVGFAYLIQRWIDTSGCSIFERL